MERKTYIKTVINKIEQNISRKINIEHLSMECFVSPRQLYRDFYSFTGHSINEYIRKRRMSKALSLLKHSNIAIAEIAYACGYSSQQAFHKSIKESIAMTPSQYRNSINTYYYFPLYEDDNIRQVAIETKIIPQMIGIKFYQSSLMNIENQAVKYLQSVLPAYTGRILGRNGKQLGNKLCYELYMEYNLDMMDAIKVFYQNDYMVTPEYEAAFALISVKNNIEDINQAWNFLYNHWLKTSMFEMDNSPYFEEYMMKDNRISKLVLHLPVKPRCNFHKINITTLEDRLFVVSSKTGKNAEKSATNTVFNFILKNHAYLFNTQKELYISKQEETYTCGMTVKNTIYTPGDGSVKIITEPKGLYAVLEGTCFDSADEYEQTLAGWLKENGVEMMGKPFSIYDITKGTKQNEVLVKTQVRIKDGRII